MIRKLIAVTLVMVGIWVMASSAQQQAGVSAATKQSIEAFLRNYYALGSDYTITVGTPKPLGNSGLSELPVDVKSAEGGDTVKMYLTSDGNYLIRGEVNNIHVDPLAENIAKFDLKDAPVYGDPKAPITLVEYGDFECPVCRNFHDAVRGMLPNYPQVKLIFKDFPIEQIHPWARTAAIAGRCVYQQNPQAFWKFYDLVYDNQDLVSASSAYEKMLEFAGKAGRERGYRQILLKQPASCRRSRCQPCQWQAPRRAQHTHHLRQRPPPRRRGSPRPPTIHRLRSSQAKVRQEVNHLASLANGKLLDVRSTPTIFVYEAAAKLARIPNVRQEVNQLSLHTVIPSAARNLSWIDL